VIKQFQLLVIANDIVTVVMRVAKSLNDCRILTCIAHGPHAASLSRPTWPLNFFACDKLPNKIRFIVVAVKRRK
jgi:hypothetical protein